ncbi:MAG: DinB family protein [Rubricoccaceae bacterium]
MLKPQTDLTSDDRLRAELVALLRGRNAHVDAASALDGIPPARINDRVEGFSHSLWDLLAHLRFAQADILEFCSPGYVKKPWPDAYWPASPASPSEWNDAVEAFLADTDGFIELARTGDLIAEFAWAPGFTLLRQILLAADHNSHHLGQVVALRRQLGLWR